MLRLTGVRWHDNDNTKLAVYPQWRVRGFSPEEQNGRVHQNDRLVVMAVRKIDNDVGSGSECCVGERNARRRCVGRCLHWKAPTDDVLWLDMYSSGYKPTGSG